MTIPELQDRIEQHKKQRAQLLANVSAFDGAIQEASHWLAVLEEEEATKKEAQ